MGIPQYVACLLITKCSSAYCYTNLNAKDKVKDFIDFIECHDITEILLKLVVNTKEIVNQNNSYLMETIMSIDG